MKLLLFELAFIQFWCVCTPLSFKSEWCQYIANLISQHQGRAFSPAIIIPQFPIGDGNPNISAGQFFLPEVIIWDPANQFPALFSNRQHLTCQESNCNQELKFVGWQDGSTSRLNPRCLYGTRGCVVLVCKIYRCSKKHTVTSCNFHILQEIENKAVIPFILLHKSGITRELQWYIFHICSQGKSFSDVESLLLWSTQDHYAQQLANYNVMLPDTVELSQHNFPKSYVSNDLITNIFIITFNELKSYMFKKMHEITSDYISCDHTFKVASHIGLIRNKKWVPQYDSLFIMQNDRGEVLFWQLVMGSSYDSIRDGMESLMLRITSKEKRVKMIIIDNCCTWRRKLHETFGEDVKIKLDLFHAVKRVSTALSKKHTYFYQAMQDFRLVFRDVGDNGISRKRPTPSPDVILKNIDIFISKWNKIKGGGGQNLLTSAVMRELEKLSVHVRAGCLSGIPSHFGTNKNENIHRSLNKRLTGTRLGVEVAVALLATFFHLWNCQRASCEKMSTIALRLNCPTNLDCSPVSSKFGIGVSAGRSYSHNNVQIASDSKDTWSIMKSVHQLKDEEENKNIYRILCRALNLLHVEEVLNGLSDTHCKVSRLLPHLHQVQNLQEQAEGSNDDDTKRLDNVMQSFKMQKIDVPKNGDCLFASVTLYLRHLFSQLDLDTDIIEHLQSININPQKSDTVTIQELRHLLVNEWLINRQDYYPFFMTHLDQEKNFDQEAEQFRNMGVFETFIGDAMLLGLSNVLRLQLVLFTSIPSWPHITICPRDPPLSQNPIYFAYKHTGSGHYSLALPTREDSEVTVDERQLQQSYNTGKSCRCGRGKNTKDKDRVNCYNKKSYSSRCPCLKSLSACTENCECTGCENVCGKRPTAKQDGNVEKFRRRKRTRYPEQDHLKMAGWKFMKTENEQIVCGTWTPQEHYVFYAIVSSMRNNGEPLQVAQIASTYTTVKIT